MQAIMLKRHGGPEVLECVELPVPSPAAGEVLVRVHTIGVGKPDVLVRSGKYIWNQTVPVVVGHEMAGHVAALGEGVTSVRVGQPVLVINAAGGGYAEYAVVPARMLTPLPDGMAVERAVGALNYLTAWTLLHEMGHIERGQTVYLNGAAGGVGTAVIQLANLAGAKVIAGASTQEKCDFARARGATDVVHYGRDREKAIAQVLELTGGRGVDLMLDQYAGPAFEKNFAMLASRAQIIIYNFTGGMAEGNVLAAMAKSVAKSPAVRVFSLHCYDEEPHKRQQILQHVLGMLARGEVASYIDRRLPLAEARQAHELLDGGKVLGKLLLTPPNVTA